ncbi:MAG: CAP domain-containing protein [bacterium]
MKLVIKHKVFLTILAIVFLIYCTLVTKVTNRVAEPVLRTSLTTPITKPSTTRIFVLVNKYRESLGLKALTRDTHLDISAENKCNDMVAKDYWAHNSPSGIEPWSFIEAQKIAYKKAGENLANNDFGSTSVVESWKKSYLHNKNLIDPEYDKVGYSVCNTSKNNEFNSNYIVVQHLIKS